MLLIIVLIDSMYVQYKNRLQYTVYDFLLLKLVVVDDNLSFWLSVLVFLNSVEILLVCLQYHSYLGLDRLLFR